MQEAQSKYEIELEADSGIVLEPATGTIGSDGKANIHFKRDPNSESKATTRVSCKVQDLNSTFVVDLKHVNAIVFHRSNLLFVYSHFLLNNLSYFQ